MKKEVLSEIDIYFGTVEMPKYFEINRDQLKANLLSSIIEDDFIENTYLMGNPYDFAMKESKAFIMLDRYIVENLFLKHKQSVNNLFHFGSVFKQKESSITKNLINEHNLENSPDYTCIYGIEVENNSQTLVIEYPNKRLKERFFQITLKNNEYIIFPSTLKYFFTRNISEKTNTYLTVAYNLI